MATPKVKVLISSRAHPNKWAYLGYHPAEELACACRIYGSVYSSLLTMDGGRFKDCTEGGKFRLVISAQRINESCNVWGIKHQYCHGVVSHATPLELQHNLYSG